MGHRDTRNRMNFAATPAAQTIVSGIGVEAMNSIPLSAVHASSCPLRQRRSCSPAPHYIGVNGTKSDQIAPKKNLFFSHQSGSASSAGSCYYFPESVFIRVHLPRRSLTKAGPWFRPLPKIKITKRTHLSFFKTPVNTANYRHRAGPSAKNEPIQAIQKPLLSSLSARQHDATVSESRI